jgi:serine/threonine protein kinase/tetratricopeptide (TPR) repeat protein
MMTSQQYERLCRLFESASELEPDQRSALLDRECADDPTVRREVEAMLALDSDPSSFLESPALGEGLGLAAADTLDLGPAECEPGRRIDEYLIRETLGEGGAAVVYLAEQEEPVRRRVALKVIKPGMDSRQVIARFEAERQALAMMDHVGVAKVFDAGSTEAGRPYFVMEHVPGISITEHCDRHRLNIEDRLRLFMQVCEAVQHAHQKGIIHRDLKPGNVLVLTKDGQAIPKVIDFGVAKALHQRLTERTIFTEQGQLIGTPAYMSPEQAEMSAQDIDTRSDIYALGVLLYELLTGALPFDPKTFREAGFGKIQRIIRDEEPPKPSTRLTSNGDGSTTHAQVCRAEPRSLIRALRGDLDWIVMKCLEKDRTRRYETAHGLALDIRRHLQHEPVQAGPPSRGYRLRKFVRRNRAAVAAGVMVAISLIAAAGVSVSFALSEAQQRDIAQAINEFLNNDLLAAVAPSAERGKGRDVLMRDVLDEAARRIEDASGVGGRFEDKALVEAAIRETLGETYWALGEYPAAELHLQRAWELRRRVLGEEHPDTLSPMHSLADLYGYRGNSEAESLLLKTIELEKRVLGEKHRDTLRSMGNLAGLYGARGRHGEAESLLLKTIELQKQVLGEEHPDTLSSMFLLAIQYWLQGRYEEAESLYPEIIDLQTRDLGEEHPDTLLSMLNLANVYAVQGRFDEAESLCLETLKISRRVLGEEHPDTLMIMNNLAYLYAWAGRYEQAESLAGRALEISGNVLGETNPNIEDTFGFILLKTGRVEEAEALFRDLAATAGRDRDGEYWLAAVRAHHGMCLVELERYEEAEPLLLKAYPWLLPLPSPVAKDTVRYLVKLYDAWGMPEEAAEWHAKLATEQDADASDQTSPADDTQDE